MAIFVDSDQNKNEDHCVVVVSVKAFGDLVIAVNCCERAQQYLGVQIILLIGQHLLPLYKALKTSLPYRVVHHADAGMPALFDIRKAGFSAAAKSARALRRSIAHVDLPPKAMLLFDRRQLREAYITQDWLYEIIPAADNIYLAYDKWFETKDTAPTLANPQTESLRIFPGSRMSAKNLPLSLVLEISEFARSRELSVELMLLDGERPDLESSGLDHTIIPRDFGAMIDAVRGAGSVVSADSMPAHIAEVAGRSAFVFSPVPNRYWLPRTTYLQGWDALFEDGGTAPAFAAFINRDPRSAL
jgi:hypothetical protein